MKTDLDPQIVSSIFELSSEVGVGVAGDDRLCHASKEQKAKFDIPEAIDADFWVSRIHPDDRDRVVLNFNQALKNKKQFFLNRNTGLKVQSVCIIMSLTNENLYGIKLEEQTLSSAFGKILRILCIDRPS